MFQKKRRTFTLTYEREKVKPVIRSSICTGEKVAGFKDLHTGQFQDVMLIRDEKDMAAFMKQYGIAESEIVREW